MTEETTYTIDQGVRPAPMFNTRRTKYPFRQMEAGDSFVVPFARSTAEYIQIYQAAGAYGRRYGWRFKFAYDTEGQLRCWRVQ